MNAAMAQAGRDPGDEGESEQPETAVLPASAAQLEKHARERKEKERLAGERRRRERPAWTPAAPFQKQAADDGTTTHSDLACCGGDRAAKDKPDLRAEHDSRRDYACKGET